MPRPNFPNFVPYTHIAATEVSLNGTEFGYDGNVEVVNTDLFLQGTAEQLHRCLNRVAKWECNIAFKVECPDDTNHEYQTFEAQIFWDRQLYFPDEDSLHMEPTELQTSSAPGRDFYVFETPDSAVLAGSNTLSQIDDGGIIHVGPGFLQIYILQFMLVTNWDRDSLAGSMLCTVKVDGNEWSTGGGFAPTASNVATGQQLEFAGTSPSDFIIRGDFVGGSVGDGFPSTILQHFAGQTYHFEMRPILWYSYTKAGVPIFDTTTGEIL